MKMDEELKRLIDNIIPCANSLKGVVDEYVNKLVGYRDASLRAEEAFQARKASIDAHIADLHAQVQQLKDERMQLERSIKSGRDDLDRVKREINREKQSWRDRIDEIVASSSKAA
jgi:septal ring factor EnvC (AmiA/AmiB activator)